MTYHQTASVDSLLDRARSAGIRIWADQGKLRFDAPAGAMDDGMRDQLRSRKSELVDLLTELPDNDQRGMAARRKRQEPVLRGLIPAAEQFIGLITEVGLAGLLKAYQVSGARRAEIALDRQGLADRLGVAVDFLCLSRPVGLADARGLMPDALMTYLTASGLATVTGDQIALPALRLVEHYGQWVFVGLPDVNGPQRNGYYGADSAGLGRLLLGAKGRCLDAFAGTATQAVVMAATASNVVSVELDTAMAPVTELNIVLNGHLDRIETRWGDINDVDLAEQFDTVSVNPPMTPNYGWQLPWNVDAGPDGCRMLVAALDRIKLSDRGQLFSNSMLLGNRANGPDLEPLRALASRKSWSVTVIPLGRRPLGPDTVLGHDQAELIAKLTSRPVAEVMAGLTEVWRAGNLDMLFTCQLTAVPADAAGVAVASLSLRGAGWWL